MLDFVDMASSVPTGERVSLYHDVTATGPSPPGINYTDISAQLNHGSKPNRRAIVLHGRLLSRNEDR